MENTKRCLVIQLSNRLDLYENLIALRAVKQKYSHIEFDLIVRSSMVEFAKKINWISNVHEMPVSDWTDQVIKFNTPINNVVPAMAEWFKSIVDLKFDYVVNWSFSNASSYLTALIPCQTKIGFSRDYELGFYCPDNWSQYVQGVVQGGISQNIHLVDILTTQLLTQFQVSGIKQTSVTDSNVFSISLSSDFKMPLFKDEVLKKFVTIDFSETKFISNSELNLFFNSIATMASKNQDTGFYIFGDSYNYWQKFLDESLKNGNDFINIHTLNNNGEDFLIGAMCRSDVFYTFSDTNAMLCSLVGKKVVLFANESVDINCNGPYGSNNYVVKYNSKEFFNSFKFNKNIKDPVNIAFYDENSFSNEIYFSKIRYANDGGGIFFSKLSKNWYSDTDWFAFVIGNIARVWYCGWSPDVGYELERECVSSKLLKQLRDIYESVNVLKKVTEKSLSICQKLHLRTMGFKSSAVMNLDEKVFLQSQYSKLEELDLLLEKIGLFNKGFEFFPRMQKIMMHHLDGRNIQEITLASVKSYEKLLKAAQILSDWIDFTFNLSKPQLIQPKEDNL